MQSAGQRQRRPVAFTTARNLCFSENLCEGRAKARALPERCTGAEPLAQPGPGEHPSRSRLQVRRRNSDALRSCVSLRLARTTPSTTRALQLGAASAATLSMVALLAPGVRAAPPTRRRCARAWHAHASFTHSPAHPVAVAVLQDAHLLGRSTSTARARRSNPGPTRAARALLLREA